MKRLHERITELLQEAENAHSSEYGYGYVNALEDVLELMEDLAWEDGEDLGD